MYGSIQCFIHRLYSNILKQYKVLLKSPYIQKLTIPKATDQPRNLFLAPF